MDEQSLIQRVQEGDREAYGPLMDIHVRRLRSILALNVPAAHLIDEIAHEAFVFAFRHIQEFQRGTSFFAWLKSIAWNLLRAEVQRFSRDVANQAKYAERRLVGALPGRTADGADRELSGLESCLEQVPPRMRELLLMRYTFAFSTQEIAEKASHTSAWVRTTLFRLRRQLKECVQGKLAEERP